jgi:hypothetical protein
MPQQLCRVGSNSRCIARLDNPVQTGNGFGGKVIEAPLLHAGMCLFQRYADGAGVSSSSPVDLCQRLVIGQRLVSGQSVNFSAMSFGPDQDIGSDLGDIAGINKADRAIAMGMIMLTLLDALRRESDKILHEAIRAQQGVIQTTVDDRLVGLTLNSGN